MRTTALILAQAGLISLLAVYGAYGDNPKQTACPLPAMTTAQDCAAPQ
ncbi:hypothetical protein rosmuc_03312 [Roseovarius mucosus DSM 17069]|uniref:Uncharacterized protein n=1 Tax=Roseovarius mucosus DSM 17069 TaxID=1288298 RepID=A0A0A0HJ93_9RHOB|nr:hypothetical protein [Roseovarius mucosus]KGM87011.1 hypothetical protein rosmuc_03312 [Roseovarius mucosus DSM 17069]